MAGVGFEAFGWEVWPYLSAGASIYIVNDNIRLEFCNLLDLFNVNKISHSFISTALVHDFVSASRYKTSALKYLLTGGDKLSSLDKEGISYRIVNNYGPTEYSVVASNYEIAEKDKISVPPIGKPIANTIIRILNEQQSLAPIGIAGELHIGGAGLARSYLNQPEATEERFVQDPFSQEQAAAIYKTGDMGRWLSDGNIQYLGRKDDQVKIRGYRIEIGEIESVLLQSGLVNQVIIIVKEDGNAGKQLVAYVVAAGSFDKHKLIACLQDKLPRFMIPALWVELERLPLTPNGKIDTKALPSPDVTDFIYNEYVAPETDVEETLAGIWRELLQLQRIGIHDNFFELGGHSLLAKRMRSYIERRLLISIPMKVLFQFTTISDLGKYVELQSSPIQKDSGEYKLLNI